MLDWNGFPIQLGKGGTEILQLFELPHYLNRFPRP